MAGIVLRIIALFCWLVFPITLYPQEVQSLLHPTQLERLFYEAHLDPVLNIAVHEALNFQNSPQAQQFYARVLVKTDNPKIILLWPKIGICSQFGPVFTGYVSVEDLQVLARLPGVRYVESGGEVLSGRSLQQVVAEEPRVKNLPESLSESGSMHPIIGIIDKGISIYDKEFIKKGPLEPRFLFVWDQTDQQGISPIEILNSYGTEYNKQDLNDKSMKNKIQRLGLGFEHGTLVAKTIVKNIPNTTQGDIIMVNSNGEKAAVVDGVYYVIKKSRQLKRPVVINLSLGSTSGPHDGTSNFEVALTNAVADGQLIVAAGGNDGAACKHAEILMHGDATNDKQITLPFLVERRHLDVGNNMPSKVCVEMWFKKKNISVTMLSPSGKRYGPTKPHEGYIFRSKDGKISVCNMLSYSPNGDSQIIIALEDDGENHLTAGVWQIILNAGKTTKKWECDAWLSTEDLYQAKFLNFVDVAKTIESPGTSVGVICVGANLSNDTTQRLALSNGPTRDGRKKPDVWCRNQSCTSFAAAQITGVVANLLAENPNLNVTEALEILSRGF